MKKKMKRMMAYLLVFAMILSLDPAGAAAAARADVKLSKKSVTLKKGKKTNVARGSFSCRQLMADLGMKYPAALIFLDWYCEDPKTAMESIRCSGG